MSTGWLHVAVETLPRLLNLPEGTQVIKAYSCDDDRTVGLLVSHADIPDEADWVSAQFIQERGGPVQFDKWVVIPNGSAAREAGDAQ